MSSSEEIRRWRVGLVGSGGIAHAHASACEQLDHVDPVIICDVSEAALQGFGKRDTDAFTVGARYLGLEKMLDTADLDIAVITNWGAQHAQTGMALARSGKVRGILCEKPITVNAAEAETLVSVAKEHRVLLAEAFKFRHHPMHLRAKELIDAGAIGEVVSFRSTFCTGGNGNGAETINYYPAYTGDEFFNTGVEACNSLLKPHTNQDLYYLSDNDKKSPDV